MDVLDEELKEFQQRLEAILKEFLDQGRIEVYGDLKIVVTIYFSIKARRYPVIRPSA